MVNLDLVLSLQELKKVPQWMQNKGNYSPSGDTMGSVYSLTNIWLKGREMSRAARGDVQGFHSSPQRQHLFIHIIRLAEKGLDIDFYDHAGPPTTKPEQFYKAF